MSVQDRKIKFRVWDTETGRYVSYTPHVGIDTDGRVYDLQNGSDGHFVLEQFTGRLDKNKKEIYEGDVVYSVFEDRMSPVVFRDHGFWVEAESYGWEGELLWNWEFLEVIGNVRQNPELL